MSQDNPADKKYMFFNIAAEITYVDQVPQEGELPNYKRESISKLYRGSEQGIPGRELARIHESFQVQFLNEYAGTIARFTKVVPGITKVVILGISLLGQYTEAEFSEGVNLSLPGEEGAQEQ